MDQFIPIPTLHLFQKLNDLLIELLRSLSPEDWNRYTLAKQWTVKDVAAHLLDINMRTISSAEGYNTPPDREINSYQDLVDYLNSLNATWVNAMKRVSPAQITGLLENTHQKYLDYHASLDPLAPAKYSVAWAGETLSLNWFHIAREYTEKWHHQQQIREATGKTEPLMSRELFYPCIDTFMQGLPHTYRNVEAEPGSIIRVTISGEAGGDWYLTKSNEKWVLGKSRQGDKITASVAIDPGIAWKLFTKGTDPGTAIQTAIMQGDKTLATQALYMISVIA